MYNRVLKGVFRRKADEENCFKDSSVEGRTLLRHYAGR
jgi:hypothetical protein